MRKWVKTTKGGKSSLYYENLLQMSNINTLGVGPMRTTLW